MSTAPSRILIKLGGSTLTENASLDATIEAIHNLRADGFDVIVVHGGGPAINEELKRRGISWTFINGQRVTTPQMMQSIESTLCGVVNRDLVRQLGRAGLPAVGFSAADRKTLLCVPASAELGLVGKVISVNAAWIGEMLAHENRPVPVIAPIGAGEAGEVFNLNADWAASHLAAALQVEQLIFLTDQAGILDEEGQVIDEVDDQGLENLIEARMVTGGMLVKVRAMIHALQNGVKAVRVLNALQASSPTKGTFSRKRPMMPLSVEIPVHAIVEEINHVTV